MVSNKIKAWKWRMGILLFILLNAAFRPCGFAEGEDKVLEAIQFRIKGYIYQRQGNFKSALEYYKKAVSVNPFYACAHNDLGILYEQKGQIQKAEQEYLTALKLDPTYTSPYTNLALLYERLGRFEDAAFYWNGRASLGEPEDTWTQNARMRLEELNTILRQEKAFRPGKTPEKELRGAEDADKFSEKSKEPQKAQPRKKAAAQKAAVELEKERAKEIKKRLAGDYKRAGAYSPLPPLPDKAGQPAVAQRHKRLHLKQTEIEDRLPRKRLRGKSARLEKEKIEYGRKERMTQAQAGLEADVRAARQKRKGAALERKRRLEESRMMERLQRRRKKDAIRPEEEVRHLAKKAYADKRYHDAALAKAEQYVRIAKEYLLSRKYDQAIAKYTAAKRIAPDYPGIDTLIHKAREEERLFELEKAEKARYARQARQEELRIKESESAARRVRGHLARAEEFLAMKEYAQAVKQYRYIQRLNPHYPNIERLIEGAQKQSGLPETIRIERPSTAIKAERPEKIERPDIKAVKPAVKKGKERKSRADKKAARHLGRAERYLRQGKYYKAISEYKKVKRFSPGYPGIQEMIDSAAAGRQTADSRRRKSRGGPAADRKEAKPKRTMLKKSGPERSAPDRNEKRAAKLNARRIAKAERYVAEKKFGPAVAEYKRVKQADPLFPDIDNLIKRAEENRIRQSQKTDKAKLLKSADSHFKKGERYYLNGEYGKAAKFFELALSANPGHFEAQRLLRYCNRRLDTAPYRPLERSVEKPAAQEGQEAPAQDAPKMQAETGPPDDKSRKAGPPDEKGRKAEPSPPVSSTGAIDAKYEVLGVVTHRSSGADLDAFNKELLKKAKAIGGDHVIQVRFFQHENYFYGYGTAVKEKK